MCTRCVAFQSESRAAPGQLVALLTPARVPRCAMLCCAAGAGHRVLWKQHPIPPPVPGYPGGGSILHMGAGGWQQGRKGGERTNGGVDQLQPLGVRGHLPLAACACKSQPVFADCWELPADLNSRPAVPPTLSTHTHTHSHATCWQMQPVIAGIGLPEDPRPFHNDLHAYLQGKAIGLLWQ